jgi:thiamine transporter ThiT
VSLALQNCSQKIGAQQFDWFDSIATWTFNVVDRLVSNSAFSDFDPFVVVFAFLFHFQSFRLLQKRESKFRQRRNPVVTHCLAQQHNVSEVVCGVVLRWFCHFISYENLLNLFYYSYASSIIHYPI